MRQIQFHFLSPCTLRNRNKLKSFLIGKCTDQKLSSIDIQYIFVSDDYLLELNQNHLNHDYYTDIITFDNSNQPNHVISEIYISVERVKDNAVAYKTTFSNELHRVIFHGLLHLLGYDDRTTTLKARMTTMENAWISEYLSPT